MVKRVVKFTPQALLSAPRRSIGIPNPSGTWILHTVSTYSFQTHKKTVELRALDALTGESHVITKRDDLSDFTWLNDDEFACLQAEKDGTTSLHVGSVSKAIGYFKLGDSHHETGKIGASAGNLKVKKLDGYTYAVVLSAPARPDGTFYNSEKAKKTHSTGKLYTGLFVRHWDRYESSNRNTLWYGLLSKRNSVDGRYELSKLTNALADTGLECPIQPFGGTDHFDISTHSILFVSKDPDLDPALNTKCNAYILRIRAWDSGEGKVLQNIQVPGFDGAMTSPCFSYDGTQGAFLSMKENGYEADKNQVFLLPSVIAQNSTPIRAFSQSEEGTWDRSPQSICFALDGRSLIATAEETGGGKVFQLPLEGEDVRPRALTQEGYMSDVRTLNNGLLFVSGTSLVDNSFYAIIDPRLPPGASTKSGIWVNSNSGHGTKLGLKADQVSSIWTPSHTPSINEKVHSIVVRPSNFSSDKKYPVAYLIHGGPQGAWGDSWSTRWNPAVFAEQGYIAIAPNPTGSTGYGQKFCDNIKHNWGGDPYEDIVNVFDWVGENMPEADNDRAVVLGASYGGYMMNWIQGHDLGRKFKAIVCHDGITSFAGLLATEELYFPFRDLGGTPWYDPGFQDSSDGKCQRAQARNNFGDSSMEGWRKWDPSEHFAKWATPQLVIHSSKDYRLAISEGLAAFNVLQARGVPSQFLTFPDENHWVLKPENSLVWHKVVLNWINEHVDLPAFADEDEDSAEFFGGYREDKEEIAQLPSQGKVET